MNKEIEQKFIDSYIVSARKDRLSYELFCKKRRDGIGRFCHSAGSLIKRSTIVEEGNHITTEKMKMFADKLKEKYCYVISWDEDVDGTTMSADTFFNRNIGVGLPVITIFDSFVIIETEQEYGAAERYILVA